MLSFKKRKCETCFNAGKSLTLISYTASCTWPDERVPESRCKVSIRSSKKRLHTKNPPISSDIRHLWSDEAKWVKRVMKKVSYMCGASLSEYVGNGRDPDEKFLSRVFDRENISCSSKIELPYFSVEAYPILCIYCGIGGTKRTLNKVVEHYPQCQSCSDKPNVLRRKRKTVVEGVFTKRRNNDHSSIRY